MKFLLTNQLFLLNIRLNYIYLPANVVFCASSNKFLFLQLSFTVQDNIDLMQQPQKNMNQRASHFVLGSVSQPGGSLYTKDYTRKTAEHDPNFKVMDPFKGNAINPNTKSNFSTTNNAMYKNWGNAEKAGLDHDKLKDLRTHHFNLGSYNPNQAATTHQYYYDKKQISSDALKNRQQSKNRMRAHYHDFKQQPYTNFKSTYNKQFAAKQADYQGYTKPDSAPNAIVFGNNHLAMVTTNNADYTKKQVLKNPVKNTLQQSSSLVLGDKGQSMETMNQLYYGQKPLMRNQLPQATMKQLRNTHFNLGGMPNNFQTQFASNYNQPPLESLPNFRGAPKYESGTWVPKDSKFDGRTTNQRQLPMRKNQPYSKAEPKTKSQFCLGNQGNSYATQFSQNFNPKQPNYVGKVQKPKDNVATGFDKGNYDTEHRSSYTKKSLADNKYKIDLTNSKGDHFKIGGDHQDNITVYQDEYRRDQQNKSTLFHKDNII